MDVENRLIPLMREGIEVVKMILFKKLRDHLVLIHQEYDAIFLSRLTGAVVNELFGTPNNQEPYISFARQNRDLIVSVLQPLATQLPEMRIALTDALRMQALCDLQEGLENTESLSQARELDLLVSDRELPLPNTFMTLVRKLGAAFDLIIPPLPTEDSPEAATN